MRVALLVSGALAALAAAQTTQTSAAASSPTPTLSPADAARVTCLKACSDSDVKCRSHCIAVPSPNEDQVNALTKCVAACPQGNGTEAETKTYIDCKHKCEEQYYFKPSSGTPQPTGGAGGSSGNGGSGSSGSGSSGSGSSGSGSSGSGGSGSSDGDNSSGSDGGSKATGGSSASGSVSPSSSASGSRSSGSSTSSSSGLAAAATVAPAALIGGLLAAMAL